jgi:hypothetical protein
MIVLATTHTYTHTHTHTQTLTLPEIKRIVPEVEPLSVVLRELRASGVALYLDLKTDRWVGGWVVGGSVSVWALDCFLSLTVDRSGGG